MIDRLRLLKDEWESIPLYTQWVLLILAMFLFPAVLLIAFYSHHRVLSQIEIAIVTCTALPPIACIVHCVGRPIWLFGWRKIKSKIALQRADNARKSKAAAEAAALIDPLLMNATGSSFGSINGPGESMGAAADSTRPRAGDTSHLASARIAKTDLSPFLDDADEPILLGRGGFGAVFLATLRGHDDVVAVKMVRDLANPRAMAMFRKEYRLHLRLSMRCAGICRMFGICENHALFKTCFVMKRYKCSLLDEIRAVPGGGGIAMERVLILGATLARTMASLHVAHNLIVADLKVLICLSSALSLSHAYFL